MKTTEKIEITPYSERLLIYVKGSPHYAPWTFTMNDLTNRLDDIKQVWRERCEPILVKELEFIEANRDYYIRRFKELKLKESL